MKIDVPYSQRDKQKYKNYLPGKFVVLFFGYGHYSKLGSRLNQTNKTLKLQVAISEGGKGAGGDVYFTAPGMVVVITVLVEGAKFTVNVVGLMIYR